MNLKIGGSNVGKLMYNGQEFGGASKLEPGTILYFDHPGMDSSKVHLSSTTKNWDNINGIHFEIYNSTTFIKWADITISGDDFKNLDISKKYSFEMDGSQTITVKRLTVDGEYRLHFTTSYTSGNVIFLVKAI